MHIVPDSGEIIKFDGEGNTDRKARAFTAFKAFLDSRVFLVVMVVMVAVLSFELGLLANLGKQKAPITITEPTAGPEPKTSDVGASLTSDVKNASQALNSSKQGSAATAGGLVASKGGTKYYYPWCGSASRISEKNKIYFASVADARAKGYTPAANCKGLQ